MQKEFYRQRLPHIQPKGESFFITFRLKDSLPKAVLKQIKFETEKATILTNGIKNLNERNALRKQIKRRANLKLNEVLDKIKTGPHHFRCDDNCLIMCEILKKHDGILYDLIAYTIMSNHVHIVINTSVQLKNKKPYVQLNKIMQVIKGSSSRYINQLLKTKGAFWEKESYDVIIRNQKMLTYTIAYILDNPVNAGIVSKREDYQWSYYKYQ